MRSPGLCCVILIFTAGLVPVAAISQNDSDNCRTAFNYYTGEFAVPNPVKICTNDSQIPYGYVAEINMPVCDDTLCANVVLKFYWDLAGNYLRFDTIPGKPLTKFDHKKFSSADYLKLDQILKTRNSTLRILKKEDLVDKSVQIKATTVDAVSVATPQTIKKSVVEGAVYSSYTLWHFVNGTIKDSMVAFTNGIYSEPVARQLMLSENYETQLFALRKWSDADYELHSDLLFQVIRQSVPLIRAYAISKTPLPFSNAEKNRQLVMLCPILDDYSKSIFLNRITTEEKPAKVLLPLLDMKVNEFSEKQIEQIDAARCRQIGERYKMADGQ